MEFTKMHGNGNDFIILNNPAFPDERLPALARVLCARHTGIGADGMIVVRPAKGDADFSMLFLNADGSLGEMCGNGARCICRYGYDNGLSGPVQHIQTTAGPVTGWHLAEELYRVRLNAPTVLELSRPVDCLDCAYVELGSPGIPHLVVTDVAWDFSTREALLPLARRLRSHPSLPKGANVNFVRTLAPDAVAVITFERGVEDFTLSCGTGAGSVAAVMTARGQVPPEPLAVHTLGGILRAQAVPLDGKIAELYLTGQAVRVCTGQFDAPAL